MVTLGRPRSNHNGYLRETPKNAHKSKQKKENSVFLTLCQRPVSDPMGTILEVVY